ncbi:zinc finger SWIM domain-containing protein 1-like isoform X2 [Acanthaster planci]|nr:zinc finger SWIM domain-containing protein 1-like isoform X2 [Acanthaster planci]
MASKLCKENSTAAGEAAGRPSSSDPQVGMKFDSYEEVEHFIREHEEINFVKFFIMNSRSVEGSRKRLPKRFLSDALKYCTVVFACVHHGEHKSTSKGMRPRQKTLRMGCPAKFRFSATPSGKQLYLADAVTQHSHPHDEVSFRSLPQKRRLTDEEREEAFEILKKQGKKSVQKHLQETAGKVLYMRDLHNLAAASRRNSICHTNIQAILDYLSQAEDQTSVVEVVTKADGRIVGIYYQDQEMKRVYASFPQYLVIDATCKYNSLRMPMYIMLNEGSNGYYEVVALYLLITSNADSVQAMMMRFKEHNPEWSDLQIIMVDKDVTERRVLREEFPAASVQMCLSHVLRRFEQDASKQRLGLQKEEEAFCLKLMRRLAGSKSEEVYMENYQQLLNTELGAVVEYYNTTWHTIREEWVEGLKSRSLVLKKGKREDPDKLNAVSEQLKSVFRDSPTPEQVMTNLKKAVESLREERDQSVATLLAEHAPNPDSGSTVVDKFEQHLTPLALKYVLRQLKLSWKVKVKTNIDSTSSMVKSSHNTLTVNVDRCPCRFWCSLCLPCRHMFAVRRTKGLPLFAEEIIGSRWSLEYYKTTSRLSPQAADCTNILDTLRKQRLGLLSRHEKYVHVSEITEQLATVVSKAPAECFDSQMEAVKKLLSCFQNGSSVVITEEINQETVAAIAIDQVTLDSMENGTESEKETHAQGDAAMEIS